MTQSLSPDPTLPFLPRSIPGGELAAIFRTLTGLQCEWWNAPQKQLGLAGGPQAWILLAVTSYQGLGWDEYRTGPTLTTDNPPALVSRISGQRVFTVQCRCESLDRLYGPWDLLERLRTGLRQVSIAAQLLGLGVALVDFRPMVLLGELGSLTSDQRIVRAAVLEVRFGMAQNVSPAQDDGGNFVTVNGSPQVPGTPPTIVGTVVGR